jgi:hypothetical protein
MAIMTNTAPPKEKHLVLKGEGRVIEVELTGKLTREDYEAFLPEVEQRLKEYGKVRVLMRMHDFHGWRLAALWQDIKFDMHHFRQFEKIAMVGEKRWQEWMSTICVPFTTGEVRFFHSDQLEAAREWVNAD